MRRLEFTLIELLVVVTIIGILASMLLPALHQAKAKAQTLQCLGNLKQMGLSYQLYEGDTDGYMPPTWLSDDHPEPAAGPTSRWGWQNRTNPNGIYADLLIDENYLDAEIWNCPAVNIQGTGTPSPMPEYAMSIFFSHFAWNNGTLGSTAGSPYGGLMTPSAGYKFAWWDMNEKGFLLADSGGQGNDYPLVWQTFWGANGPARHGGNYQNVVFFDGHAASMVNRTFWPDAGNGGGGTWYNASVDSVDDIPYIAWRPSIKATSRAW